MIELPATIRPRFVVAGWYPDRHANIRFDHVENLRSFSMAAQILFAFGGLSVGSTGPGRDSACSDIYFHDAPSIDHRYAVAELESPGDDLFPLGDAHLGHLELFLDVHGRLIVYGVPDGALSVAGKSFTEGVERLLLGYAFDHDSYKNVE